jgi:hypothetical protein
LQKIIEEGDQSGLPEYTGSVKRLRLEELVGPCVQLLNPVYHSLEAPGFINQPLHVSREKPVSSLCLQMQLAPLHTGDAARGEGCDAAEAGAAQPGRTAAPRGAGAGGDGGGEVRRVQPHHVVSHPRANALGEILDEGRGRETDEVSAFSVFFFMADGGKKKRKNTKFIHENTNVQKLMPRNLPPSPPHDTTHNKLVEQHVTREPSSTTRINAE